MFGAFATIQAFYPLLKVCVAAIHAVTRSSLPLLTEGLVPWWHALLSRFPVVLASRLATYVLDAWPAKFPVGPTTLHPLLLSSCADLDPSPTERPRSWLHR